MAPVKKRSVEAMLVRPNMDGTYTASWTPSAPGWYQIKVLIDGTPISANQSVQVGEPPKGMIVPQPLSGQRGLSATPKSAVVGRQRKFVGRHSSGLRIRALPSLQSEQIGRLQPGAVITVCDEMQNDDGVWVRLAPPSVAQYCHMYNEPNCMSASNFAEAWCLQYNQHLDRNLLVAYDEDSVKAQASLNGSAALLPAGFAELAISTKTKSSKKASRNDAVSYPAVFHVIKCGSAGHNVRARPQYRAPVVGMLVMGNVVTVDQEVINAEGVWYKLAEESQRRYCFNTDGECWTLGSTEADMVYLQQEADIMQIVATDESDTEDKVVVGPRKSYAPEKHALPPPPPEAHDTSNTNVTSSHSIASESELGSISSSVGEAGTLSMTMAEQEKTENTESNLSTASASSATTATTAGSKVAAYKKKLAEAVAGVGAAAAGKAKEVTSIGVNVKEMVRSFSRESSPTPTVTPPTTPRPSRHESPHLQKRPSLQAVSSQPMKSLREMARRRTGSSSDITRPSDEHSSKEMSTQTSPPEEGVVVCAPPSTMTSSTLSDTAPPPAPPSSPTRPPKSTRSKRERPSSPQPNVRPPPSTTAPPQMPRTPVKEAMSNSIAECLRAVFAAFIWHEGILHDAMAAASYLKFSHDLTKDVVYAHLTGVTTVAARTVTAAPVVSREQKQKYRHSVEVSQLRAMQMNESYVNANIDMNKPIEELVAAAKPADVENENEVFVGDENKPPVEPTTEDPTPALEQFQVPDTLVHLLFMWDQVSKACAAALSQPVATTPAADSPATTPVQMFSRIMPQKPTFSQQSSLELAVPPLVPNDRAAYANPYCPVPSVYSNFKILIRPRDAMLPPRMRLSAGRPAAQQNMFGEAALLANGVQAGVAAELRDGTSECELCGHNFPYPVTRHMRRAHPGCGEHAGGKGYNSSGAFCGGWAGHCGDGGVGSSNWYLICDRCREKWLALKQRGPKAAKQPRKEELKLSTVKPFVTTPTRNPSPACPLEAHQLMRENAMFLLRLASAVEPVSNVAGAVKHHRLAHDFACPPGKFECLESLGVQRTTYKQRLAELENLTEDEIRAIQTGRPANADIDVTVHRRSEDKTTSTSSTASTTKAEFQRSVSIGLSEQRERVVMTPRKRATSTDSSPSIVCQPSAALLRLVDMAEHAPLVPTSAPGHFASRQSSQESGLSRPPSTHLQRQHSLQSTFPAKRPVLAFVCQPHDLQILTAAIKNAIRKVACRAYALQALSWLMRNVTQPMALHDLMWSFVASLSPRPEPEAVNTEQPPQEPAPPLPDNRRPDQQDDATYNQQQSGVCVHPAADLAVAGDALKPLQEAFHAFLQTVSDIMPLLPVASPLQQIAIRCFCLHFEPADHAFLHRGHVFANISKILSKNEEDMDEMSAGPSSPQRVAAGQLANVDTLLDVTAQLELKASSRQAMIGSLVDNSTETFWESGDEDRNKTKAITATSALPTPLRVVYVHVDNCRDLGAKIAHICFKANENGECSTKIRSVDVDARFAGWISCILPGTKVKTVKIELKGPDNTLRLRQVKILASDGQKDKKRAGGSYVQIQQLNCETETLRVFRLLTSQVIVAVIYPSLQLMSCSGVRQADRQRRRCRERQDGADGLADRSGLAGGRRRNRLERPTRTHGRHFILAIQQTVASAETGNSQIVHVDVA